MILSIATILFCALLFYLAVKREIGLIRFRDHVRPGTIARLRTGSDIFDLVYVERRPGRTTVFIHSLFAPSAAASRQSIYNLYPL